MNERERGGNNLSARALIPCRKQSNYISVSGGELASPVAAARAVCDNAAWRLAELAASDG